MRNVTITISQAARFVRFQAPRGGNVHVLSLIRGLQGRYGFLQAPSKLEEYNYATGITFLQGDFREQFSIDRFQVFENGLAAMASKVDTAALDEFIDDVISWARDDMGVKQDTPKARSYLSNLEFESDFSLDHCFGLMADVGRAVSSTVAGYGFENVGQYGLSSIAFNYDTTLSMPPHATSFSFERRAGRRFSENVYFSSAPLSTADHIEILTMMERLLTNDTIAPSRPSGQSRSAARVPSSRPATSRPSRPTRQRRS